MDVQERVKTKVKPPPDPEEILLLRVFGPLGCVWIAIISPSDDVVPICFFVGLCFLIAASVIEYVFLFRLWQLAQSSNLGIKKPTPGKAIGFFFIPYFNLYWAFILHRNLSLHLNSLTKYNKIPVNLVTIGVALLVSIILSPVGLIILLITLFFYYKSAKELLA